MRKYSIWFLLTTFLLTCVSCTSNQRASVEDDLAFLCSKECFGRLPGSEGNFRTEDYIAAQFEAAGLQPIGYESYFHAYRQFVFDAQAKTQELKATYQDGTTKIFYSGTDFYPYPYLNGTFSGNILSPLDAADHFLVQSANGTLTGEKITFTNSEMVTARLISDGAPPPFRCNSTLYSEIKNAINISLEGKLQLREDTVHNIVGVLPGKTRTDAIIISAHLDHVGGYGEIYYPGALDNASGVAALLQTVRLMIESQPPIDVLFVVFNGEDMGQLGSRAFLENPLPYEHVNAINIDVVGATGDNGFALLGDKPLSQAVLQCWNESGWPTTYLEEDVASDHMTMNQTGIPAVTVSSNIGFNTIAEKTHYPTDNITNLDPIQIENVASAVIEYIFSLDFIQILSPTFKESFVEPDELEMQYEQAEAAILALQPASDEMVVIESDGEKYIVRNVTQFASPEALRVYIPDVQIPNMLGDFKLLEEEPLSVVGYITKADNGAVLGIDTYLCTDKEIVQPGQVYPLPKKYYQHSYALAYQDSSGNRLELRTHNREHFTVDTIISGWDKVETTAIADIAVYICYRHWENGAEYLSGVVLDHPELPGILTVTKQDILSDVNVASIIDLVSESFIALKKLPVLF